MADELLLPADIEQAIIDELSAPSFSLWTPGRQNIFDDPHALSLGGGRWSASSTVDAQVVQHDELSWVQFKRATTAAARLVEIRAGQTFEVGETYRAVGKLFSSIAYPSGLTMGWRPSTPSNVNNVAIPGFPTSLPANVPVPFDVTFTPGATPSTQAGLVIIGLANADPTVVGSTFEATEVSIERASTSDGTPVFGDEPESLLRRGVWAAAANASDSFLLTREATSGFVIGTSIPDPKPNLFLRVIATGGPQLNLVLDEPLVTLEAFGLRESAASSLLGSALARLQLAVQKRGMIGSEPVSRLRIAGLPQNYPLPSVPSHKRYISTIAPAVRRRITTL